MTELYTIKENVLSINYRLLIDSLKEYCLLIIIGIIIGIIISKIKAIGNLLKKIFDGLKKFFIYVKNSIVNGVIEDIVLSLSVILVALSIIFECSGITNGFPNIVLNIFGTLIVSWLVTKKSSEKELKKTQEETAKKSRRYLNTIKKYTKNAVVVVDEAKQNVDKGNYIEILKSIRNQVEIIQSGIETALSDWEDLMSAEDVNAAKSSPLKDENTMNDITTTVPIPQAIESYQNDASLNQDEA